jgi:hypothetical protein
MMAKGAHEIRGHLKHDIGKFSDESDIQKRLDDFYMSRIGIQIVSSFDDMNVRRLDHCFSFSSLDNTWR